MKCCTRFNPNVVYRLENKDYAERILLSGFCPKCGSWVVELGKRNYDGQWVYESAKRKKAVKLFRENENSIIGDYIVSVKYGNKSNMGFRYGLNTEIVKDGESTIKRYAVDFNGTKEVIY